MKFDLLATDGPARRGTLTLAHGKVETPAFMPVGTYGTVKAMSPAELVEIGADIVLGNTFHLWLRPGLEVVAAHGGLHRFMGWGRPILTDSGGFQVYSLGPLRKVSEEGVAFQSPVNGDKLFLTPEESMRIQRVLDSDIVMIFDECTAYPATRDEAAQSMRLSLLIMANIPLALVGAVLGLWISGQPLSVAALIGFITLAGISVRNGILKVSHYINLMRMEGESFDHKMILRGSLERLSPVLMTALVTAFALAPLLFEAERPGTEILHPVAVVIFSGLISSTLLDTFLTPAMFWLFGRKDVERLMADRDIGAL